jgi:Na+-driven multidrug efflux pump
MTVSLFLPSGLGNAASRYISFHLGAGDPAAARSAYRVLTAAGYACAALLAAVVGVVAVRLPGVTTGDAVMVAILAAVYSGYSVAKGSPGSRCRARS